MMSPRSNMKTFSVRAAGDLARVAERVRGRGCDLKQVALDPDRGELHVPILDRDPSGRGSGPVAAQLIVRRIVEFAMEGSGGVRWFELDGIAYDDATRRLSIRSDTGLAFVLTVDHLDVALKPRDPSRH